MPLTQQEAQLFVGAFQKALGQFTGTGEAPPAAAPQARSGSLDSALAHLCLVAAELVETLATIATDLKVMLGHQQEDGATVAPATGRKRGPKPKSQTNGQSVSSDAQPTNPPDTLGFGPPPVATPLPIPGTAPAAAPPKDDPLGDMPDFLNRTQPQAAPEPPPPVQLSEQQMKDTLRAYMQKHGEQGTAKLTNLLQTIGGVKRFSELPPEKWPAVLQAANAELRT